ncbi:glycosyltransferase family 9 protein [Methylomonas paludis]|uniref:Glycosyltransferase family 9 protein n=1 Tax=Methylomonas paludis TaxID=1173101 RepID=A0A975RA41_9GAMM|nr:glycosyltransferase family 9 protein [Methylomonas paludis]QWF70938.1 glycosyltransferase family 9 protein [Methylomonas paludis]
MIHNILRFCLTQILLFGDFFINRLTNTRQSGLVIIRLNAIGDFILWLDTAKEYRRLYPNTRITLIANSLWSDWAKHFSYWDEVWPIQLLQFTRNPLYHWQTVYRLRKAGFAIAIQPTYSRLFLHGDIMIRATGAAQRIGSQGDLSNITARRKHQSDFWYTKLLPSITTELNELDRNAEFIALLTGKPYHVSLPKLPHLLELPVELNLPKPYFVVFPGALWFGRQWPVANFAELINKLNATYGYQAVLCGSAAELKVCEQLASMTQAHVVNLAGKTSLMQFAELVRSANLLIGNETSAIHIATAVNTASVCILGGGHFGRFLPYAHNLTGIKPYSVNLYMPCFNCNWICTEAHDKLGPVPCIANISVDMVWSACRAILSPSKT